MGGRITNARLQATFNQWLEITGRTDGSWYLDQTSTGRAMVERHSLTPGKVYGRDLSPITPTSQTVRDLYDLLWFSIREHEEARRRAERGGYVLTITAEHVTTPHSLGSHWRGVQEVLGGRTQPQPNDVGKRVYRSRNDAGDSWVYQVESPEQLEARREGTVAFWKAGKATSGDETDSG